MRIHNYNNLKGQIASSTNDAGKTCRRMKFGLYMSCFMKIRSKWIKNFSLKPQTLTQVKENIGCSLHAISVGKDSMNRTPCQELRLTIDKWEFMKISNFWTIKETTSLVKRKPTEWKGIFASYTCDREVVFRIYRELRYQ